MQYQPVIDRFTQLCRETFSTGLTGVYLHGSLAMGCFNPAKSDLDLLVVVNSEPTDGQKLAFMQALLPLNAEAPAKGIEMSIVTEAAVKPFQYPTPFVLHFSPMHLDRFRQDPVGYVQQMKGTDPDLAAHCTVLRQRGIRLLGAPIPEVFGEVPRAAYLDSILQDVSGAEEDILTDPVYMTLNLCRVLAYAREGLVLSKQEGAQWALRALPEDERTPVRQALEAYTTDRPMQPEADSATAFARYMLGQIRQEAADN